MKGIKKIVVPDVATRIELERFNEIPGAKVSQIEGMNYMKLEYLGENHIYEPDFEKGKDKNGNYKGYILRNSSHL